MRKAILIFSACLLTGYAYTQEGGEEQGSCEGEDFCVPEEEVSYQQRYYCPYYHYYYCDYGYRDENAHWPGKMESSFYEYMTSPR